MKNPTRKVYKSKLVSFKFQCHENIDGMTPTERGKFCQSCAKSIYDFRDWTPKKISDLVQEKNKQGEQVCGIFKPNQIQQYHTTYTTRKGRLHPRIILVAALWMVFGTSLISCETTSDPGVAGEPIIEDMGIVEAISDTILPEDIVMGKALAEPGDTTTKTCTKTPVPPKKGEVIEIGEIEEPPPIPVPGEPELSGIMEPDIVGDIAPPELPEPPIKVEDEIIYQVVDEQPTFPGGNEVMFAWLGDYLKYPTEAKEMAIEGRVYVRFIVTDEGSIDSLHVVRGVHELLDKEALRVMKLMPNWEPGKVSGKSVNTEMTLPITFKLQ